MLKSFNLFDSMTCLVKLRRWMYIFVSLIGLTGCQLGTITSVDGLGADTGGPLSLTLVANFNEVNVGESAKISWVSSNATECIATGDWSGAKTLSGEESVGPLLHKGVFNLECKSNTQSISKSIEVGISPAIVPPAPILNFSVSENVVESGALVDLSWDAIYVSSCLASGDWSGTKTTKASQVVGPLFEDSTFILECDGDFGFITKSLSVSIVPKTIVPSPSSEKPIVVLNSSAYVVAPDTFVDVSWSAVNADACFASIDWSGDKTINGFELFGPIINDVSLQLTCTGAGGSTANTIVIKVSSGTLPEKPVVVLESASSSVVKNANVGLSWSSANADICLASGDWSGAKALSGSETIGPVVNDLNLQLSCTGLGGTTVKILAISVLTGSGLKGNVDSSYVSRLGRNQIYLYKGFVTPDDFGGSGANPFLAVDVMQKHGECSFSYELGQLPEGDYTLAFTAEAENDAPLLDDAINISRVYQFSHTAMAEVHNITADTIHRVGPTRSMKTVQAAAAIAQPGDVIEIDAGIYEDDIVVWRTNDLTIRGVGGRAHIKSTYTIPYSGTDLENGKGLWVVKGSRIVIENIEFSNAAVTDENGAGIRGEGNDLTVCGSYFHDNENGFLGGAYGTLVFEFNEFNHNGFGYGQTHNMYIDDGDKFVLRHNYSHHAVIGHNVKTRAKENYIFYNRIMDESDGNSSYGVDVSEGGLTYLVGNVIQQGPSTDNSTIVSYGAEGLSSDGRTHKIFVVNNTFVNDLHSGRVFYINPGVVESSIINNLYAGGASVNGIGNLQNNLQTDNPGFVDMTGFDYRLISTSPAVDGGADPGFGAGVDLTPAFEYLHPVSRQDRSVINALDIGAYEYSVGP